MSDANTLRQIRGVLDGFLTTEVRERLQLPPRPQHPPITIREDAVQPKKRARGLQDQSASIVQWEHARAREELEEERLAHKAEKHRWEHQRAQLERQLDSSMRDNRYLKMEVENREKETEDLRTETNRSIQSLRQKLDSLRAVRGGSNEPSTASVPGSSNALKKLEEAYQAQMEALKEECRARVAMIEETHSRELERLHEECDRKMSYWKEEAEIRTLTKPSESTSGTTSLHNTEEESAKQEVLRLQQGVEELQRAAKQHQATIQEQEEQISTLRRRASQASEAVGLSQGERAELEELRQQRKSWDSLFAEEEGTHVGGRVSAARVLGVLCEAREAAKEAQWKYSQCSEKEAKLRTRVRGLEAELGSELAAHTAVRQAHEVEQLAHTKSQSLLRAAEGELRHLRELLATYDRGETRAGQLDESGLRATVQKLREELSERDALVKQYQLDAAQAVPATALSCEQARLRDLQEEFGQLKRLSERMQKELDQYRTSAAAGEVQAGTKVLHIVDNPSAQAARERVRENRERLETLEEENEALRGQIAALEAGGATAAGSTDSMPSPGLQPEMFNKRIKEMFKEKIDQFRRTIFTLFGYDLFFIPKRQSFEIKLRSVHALSEDDFLQFEPVEGEDGKVDYDSLRLMSTPFALWIQREKPALIHTFLQKFDSLPLFLGEVTRFLFENSTNFRGS